MPTQKLTPEIITAAVLGFEQQKTHIDAKIAELRALLPGGSAETAATLEVPIRKRKKFSAASRRKMAMAQKARWAKLRGEAEPTQAAKPEPEKPKRKLSAAAKAKLVANLKKARAAKAAKAKAPAKKASPARKQTTPKKAAVKKVVAKKSAAKKTAPVAQAVTKGVAQ